MAKDNTKKLLDDTQKLLDQVGEAETEFKSLLDDFGKIVVPQRDEHHDKMMNIPAEKPGPLGHVKVVERQFLVQSSAPDWVQPVGNRHRNEVGLEDLQDEVAEALGDPMPETEMEALKAEYRQVATGPFRRTFSALNRKMVFDTIHDAFDGRVPESEVDLVLGLWEARYGKPVPSDPMPDFDADPAPPASPLTIDDKYVKPLFLGKGEKKSRGVKVLWDVDKESSPGVSSED